MAIDDARYLPEPPRRSIPARILAVAALAGTVIVLYLVISSSLGSDDGPVDGGAKVEKKNAKKKGPETPKEYTVQAGDSISGIAVKYGISVDRIERLNPELDPQALATGQVIKLQK